MPIPFPTPTPNVPIIGQPIVVEGYTVSTVARCQCEAGGSPVLLTVTCSAAGLNGLPNVCQRCHTNYAVQGMQLDQQGQLTFQIAVLSNTPAVSQ